MVQYRDSVLRVSDVARHLPPGLSSADSMALASSFIRQWIEGFLIEDLAAGQIDDIDRIDELTSAYRRSLIADSYRRKMRAKGVQPIDMESVRKYYREHIGEMRLERPILKGLYIKIPSRASNIDEIREWMANGTSDTYDALEKSSREDGVTFRYFADRWVDLDAIASEIPFGTADVDRILDSARDFETESDGNVYLLHVTDIRKSGQTMPEEYAAPLIEDRMKANNLVAYEEGLIEALRRTAIEKNILIEGNNSR